MDAVEGEYTSPGANQGEPIRAEEEEGDYIWDSDEDDGWEWNGPSGSHRDIVPWSTEYVKQQVLERGADPSEFFRDALYRENYELAEFLLEQGVNPDEGFTAGRSTELMIWLIGHGANPRGADFPTQTYLSSVMGTLCDRFSPPVNEDQQIELMELLIPYYATSTKEITLVLHDAIDAWGKNWPKREVPYWLLDMCLENGADPFMELAFRDLPYTVPNSAYDMFQTDEMRAYVCATSTLLLLCARRPKQVYTLWRPLLEYLRGDEYCIHV